MNEKKHRTEAQKQAARLNGAKSRGPVTPEGKAISAQNAMRHGLTAKRVILTNELPQAWDDFLEALTEEWNPQTATELQLIHDYAAARWRLNRLLDIETESINLEMVREQEAYSRCILKGSELTRITLAWQSLQNDGTLPLIHRHEVRLRRVVRESLNQLMAIRTRRLAEQELLTPEPLPASLQNEPEPPSAPVSKQDEPQQQRQNEPEPAAVLSTSGDRQKAQNEPGDHPTATQSPHPHDPKRPAVPPLPELRAA